VSFWDNFGYKYRDADEAPKQKKGFFAQLTPAPRKVVPPSVANVSHAELASLTDYITGIDAYSTPLIGRATASQIYSADLEVNHPRAYGRIGTTDTGPR